MKIVRLLLLIMLLVPMTAMAQGNPVYHNATEFPLYGKISDATNARYERLPGHLEGVVRKPVWNLGRNSAGLYVRFRSDSPVIWARWKPTRDYHMDHMADTGTKGLDLYMLTDEGWRYMSTFRPRKGENSIYTGSVMCDAEEREYMMYLSLYDGVDVLEIGVQEGSFIGQPVALTPDAEKPVIMYGSSILQGGCASRPGMAHTNILARRLDRQVINLGFSGNAFVDLEIAELMASCADPGVFVLDYVPNATDEYIDERAEKFFRILRDAHPDVPVVFIEIPNYPRGRFSTRQREMLQKRNDAQRRVYEKLRKAGEKRIFYIESEGMLGDDMEATVDGTHFTDLGMMRYVDHVLPTIRKALRK